MNRNVAAGAVVLSVIAGVGLGFALQSSSDSSARAETPSSSAPPTTPEPDPTPEDATVGTLVPGRLGAVRVGMDVDTAIATGWIEPDPDRGEACEGTFYRWIDTPETTGLDVVETDGLISSIGAFESSTVTTGQGLGIGSTYGEVLDAYESLAESVNDYGQATVAVKAGSGWLGYLFDATPDELTDDSRVVFMEATSGVNPGLLRDGC